MPGKVIGSILLLTMICRRRACHLVSCILSTLTRGTSWRCPKQEKKSNPHVLRTTPLSALPFLTRTCNVRYIKAVSARSAELPMPAGRRPTCRSFTISLFTYWSHVSDNGLVIAHLICYFDYVCCNVGLENDSQGERDPHLYNACSTYYTGTLQSQLTIFIACGSFLEIHSTCKTKQPNLPLHLQLRRREFRSAPEMR